MTVSENEALYSGPYLGGTSAVVFDYDFTAPAETDVLVLVTNVSTGDQTELTLATDYTVAGAGVSGGGTITLVDAARVPAGFVMSIAPNIPYNQTRPFTAQTSTTLPELEAALDKLTLLTRQLLGDVTRAIKVPVGEDFPSDAEAWLRSFLSAELAAAVGAVGSLGMWHVDAASAGTFRGLSTGQSPVVRATTVPVGGIIPTIPETVRFWDNATDTFVASDGSDDYLLNYVPLIAKRINERTTIPVDWIATGKGATGIEGWTGSAADRSTHTVNLDEAALVGVLVGDVVSWPADDAVFPDGTGVVTAVTDSGATGVLSLRITSGRSMGDNYQLFDESGVKIGRVNGEPDTTNREQFVEIVNKFDKTGWTEPLHYFLYGGFEANGLDAHETLIFLRDEFYDVLIAELEAFGIIGKDTRIAIVSSYHKLVDEYIAYDYNRAPGDQYVMAQHDARAVFVPTTGLSCEPAEEAVNAGVHLGFDAIQKVPDRFEAALVYGNSGANPAVLDAMDAFGNLGFAPWVERNAVTADTTLALSQCMGGVVQVDTSGGPITLSLPDLTAVSAWQSVRRAYSVFINVTDASNPLTIAGNGKNFRTPSNRTSLATLEVTGTGLVEIMYRGNWYVWDHTHTTDASPAVIRDTALAVTNSDNPLKRMEFVLDDLVASRTLYVPAVHFGEMALITADPVANLAAINQALADSATSGRPFRQIGLGSIPIDGIIRPPTGARFVWEMSGSQLVPQSDQANGFIRPSVDANYMTDADIVGVRIRPEVDGATGLLYTGNGIVGRFRRCRVDGLDVHYEGDQAGLFVVEDCTFNDLRYHTDSTDGGTGGPRVLGGRNTTFHNTGGNSGDDGPQLTPAKTGVFANLNIDGVVFNGGWATSHGRPFIVLVDSTLTCSITNSGMRNMVGVGEDTVWNPNAEAVVVGHRGATGWCTNIIMDNIQIDEASRASAVGIASGLKVQGAVRSSEFDVSVINPARRLLTVEDDPTTLRVPMDNTIRIRSNMAPRNTASAQTAISVAQGTRNTITPDIVAPAGSHAILDAGTYTHIKDGSVRDVASGFAGLRVSAGANARMSGTALTGVGNAYSYAAGPAATGWVHDCDLGGMSGVGAVLTSNNKP